MGNDRRGDVPAIEVTVTFFSWSLDYCLALGAVRHPAHFYIDQLFNRFDVGSRPRGQILVLPDAANIFSPTAYSFIDGFCFIKLVRVQLVIMDFSAVVFVTRANLDFLELAQHVQFGQEQFVNAVDLRRETRQFRSSTSPSASPTGGSCAGCTGTPPTVSSSASCCISSGTGSPTGTCSRGTTRGFPGCSCCCLLALSVSPATSWCGTSGGSC